MNSWIGNIIGAYAPAFIGWVLALAGWLRLEQLRIDPQAQALVPVLQWGVVSALLVTLGCIVVASAMLARRSRS